MDPTSAHLPVCVHCGTPRPADESQCPECGKPWIDTVVAAVAAARTTAVHATPAVTAAPPTQPVTGKPPASDDAEPFDDTSEFFTSEMWEDPPPEPRRWIAWLVGAVVLLVAVGAWAYIFLDSDPSAAPAASPTTSAASPVTTVAAAGATSPTSTEATTTSTAPTTTTPAPAYPSPSDWPAADSAIPIGELELKAAGVGPLSLGSPIGEVASTLTASFGTADTAGDEGSCPAEAYWLRWGGFTVYFDGYAPDASLVAYRLDGPTGDPALQTLSGVSVGDTLDDLESTYSSYTVAYEVIDSHDHFRLSSGGSLLLWGPVSGTEADAIVEGIYSPGPCDATG